MTFLFSQAHQVAEIYRSKHICHAAVSNSNNLVEKTSKDVLRFAFLKHQKPIFIFPHCFKESDQTFL